MILYKPKEDFEQSIKRENLYVELLKDLHKEMNEKIKSGKGYQLAKNKVDLYELATKLDTHIELLKDRINHYNNWFLPKYNKELEECEKEFDKTMSSAKKYIDKEKDTEVSKKIVNILSEYDKMDLNNRNHIEIKNVVYKDLKLLLKISNK